LHRGEISLECSRPGAAAVALWATQRLFTLVPGGAFARALGESRAAALTLYEKLRADARFLTAFPPELDILVWAPRARRASDASQLARRLFAEAARRGLHLALAELPVAFFDLAAAGMGQSGTRAGSAGARAAAPGIPARTTRWPAMATRTASAMSTHPTPESVATIVFCNPATPPPEA